jgi:uroporphyrinogen decarboxylase
MPERPSCHENLRTAARGGEAAWIPFTLDIGAIPGMTEPILRQFRERTGGDDPAEFFDYDFRTCSLVAAYGGSDAREHHEELPPDTSFDEWGIGHWAGGAEGTYEKMYSPLASVTQPAQIEAYPEPQLKESQDIAVIEDYHVRGYPVFGYAGSLYEWSWWLRGMQAFLEDLILNPKLIEALTAKVAAYVRKLALKSAEAGIDVLCFFDDVGMQAGMQISPDLWRMYVKPHWESILSEVRESHPDCLFFLHSCGNIAEILEDIIQVGFHILHPVQPECMDFKSAHMLYGEKILLCATLSAQRIFPFGSPEEVRGEVRRLKSLCQSRHRAILCPSNMIQPETPWENIEAFVEEARSA